jgi:putative NIF3 family GTP cyclohydrolase 1 type 2
MARISEIIRVIETLSGHPLNRDEGLHHGMEDRDVHGLTVAWMATPDAIRAAGEAGHELLIGHESLYYPYDVVVSSNPPEGWREWPVNALRRALLDEFRLDFLRVHGSADEICILDTFADVLGLDAPVYDRGWVKVYEIEPQPLAELIARVKERCSMAAVRVSSAGDETRIVQRVGLPWGGMGLFVNVDYQRRLIAQGCDVLIAGETDNYGFRFAAECGVPMIETSHEISENPGLRRFSALLADHFPDIDVSFYENDCIWKSW